MAPVSGYLIAHTAIVAILVPAVLALGYFSIRHVRREGDPLRGGFKWYHASLWLLFLSVSPPHISPFP